MLRIFALLCLILAPGAFANDYLQELQRAAKTAHLADDPQWHSLLHYAKPYWPGPARSQADDAGFFNAPAGKTDASAELDATLARFFDQEALGTIQQLPQCRFAARYQWLKSQLHFDPLRLPEQDCPRLNTWLTALNPAGATLIFPSAHINSPASMFGHTLLRIDAKGQTERTRLLAYAINYAANADPGDGFTFALKGLTGTYPGIMSNSPYYVKVREYTDMESRDIWEYQLTLNTAEIDQLLRHVWELSSTRFDYWFFDENCSYMLLTLLDVARPGLNLARQFRWNAIPVDTVRAVAAQEGLVASSIYRPSVGTEIAFRATQLLPEERSAAIAITEGRALPASVLGKKNEAATLELADLLINFRGQAGKISEEEGMPRLHEVQKQRSKLAPLDLPAPPKPAAPESGHLPMRASLLAGNIEGKAGLQLQYHPAYHDLLDPDQGFVRGAQIGFFDMAATQRTSERWQIDHFIPVDIVSLAPVQDWYQAPSWRVRFGLERVLGYDEKPGAVLAGGPGIALESPDWLVYVYLDNQLIGQRDLNKDWAVGTGPMAGAIWNATASTRVQIEGGKQWFNTEHGERSWAHLKLRQQVSHANNLVLQATWQENKMAKAPIQKTVLLGWQHYF